MLGVLAHSLMITGFVAIMMIAVEYVNIQTAGPLTDRLLRHVPDPRACDDLVLHEGAECRCFPYGEIVGQLRRIRASRLLLVLALAGFLAALIAGVVGLEAWNWVRVSLVGVTLFGLFIALTVPDHFLVEHLWGHVMLRHLPRIFLWTFGVMAVLHLLGQAVDIESAVTDNRWTVLALALLLGLIPESGPHLLFVTLFSQGALPFGILAANSAVQDGHGMLPLLAHSRKAFLQIKAVNLLVGLLLGVLFLLSGS